MIDRRIIILTKKGLKCYCIYANSVRNKIEELKDLCTEEVDVIGISEVWGRSGIRDADYDIDGYQLFRRDHKTGHGGVVIYVQNKLQLCSILTIKRLLIQCLTRDY